MLLSLGYLMTMLVNWDMINLSFSEENFLLLFDDFKPIESQKAFYGYKYTCEIKKRLKRLKIKKWRKT